MIRLTPAHYQALAVLAAQYNQKLEISMPDGKQDIVGVEAGDVIMDDMEYYRLARRVGYVPYADKSKTYKPNGSREMRRRQRRMK